jgi:hypothetical protein
MNADTPSSNTTPEYVPETSYTPTTPPPPSNTTPLAPMNPPTPPSNRPLAYIKTGRSFPYGTALIALVVVAVCAGALYAFAGAEVQITPETQQALLNGQSFTATNGAGDLPFTTVTVNKSATAVVTAESTETVNDPAQGSITISNAQAKPQTLINNTRFQTPAGLVFRIHAPVTIPAETASGPGTLTATVFADQAGATYNVGPTTFTLPGLQNTPTFSLITAKSTSAMVGGFAGTRPAVSQSTDDSQHATLQSGLATTLQAALANQIPSGDVVVPGGTFTTYQTEPDAGTSTNSVAVTEQGTLSAVAFPEDALAKAIAYQVIGTYSGEPITLSNANTLTLAPTATSTDPSSLATFDFTLNGNATLIWQVDASKIAGAVAGKTRDSAQSILSGFPEVNKAVLILRPFWSDTFPADPSHIHVTVEPAPKSS